MRLVDADKTIGHIKTRLLETALNNCDVVCDASYLYQECADNRIETWIDEIPTVDAVPVNHGHWDCNGFEPVRCSVCGITVDAINGIPWAIKSFNYCPNCGAKMDEVEENG